MLLLLIVHIIIFVIMSLISALCGVTYDEDKLIGMICPFIGIATTIYAIQTAIEKKLDKYDLIDVDFKDVNDNIIREDDRSIYIEHKVCLSYKQFVDFYSVNPARWNIVKKSYPERRYLRFKNGETWYWIYFKTAKEYKAAVKYYYMREEVRNGPRAVNYNPQEKEKLDKDTAALLRCVQADINKIKFQAESEINEATDGIKKISERLNS